MKNPVINLRVAVLALVAVMAFTGLAEARWGQPASGCNQNGGRGQGRFAGRGQGNCQTALADLPREDLNDFEKESLLLMREEEKLARDVYQALGQKYSLRVFNKIPRAEQRHMDQLGFLLERYGLEDPIAGMEPGQFSHAELQRLHDQLVAQGNESEVAALKVGATIEDLDISDLNSALASGKIDNQDITRVYENLAKGSRNHMRAFAGRLAAAGETYQAQYVTQADLDAILASDHERAMAGGGQMMTGKRMTRVHGPGQGWRSNQGNCAGCLQACTSRSGS